MTDLSTYRFSRTENIVFYICTGLAGLLISYLMYRNILFAPVIIPLAPKLKEMAQTAMADREKHHSLAHCSPRAELPGS